MNKTRLLLLWLENFCEDILISERKRKNRPEVLAGRRARYAENPEPQRRASRDAARQGGELILAKRRARYAENPEPSAAQSKKWRQSNKEHSRVYKRNYVSVKRAHDPDFHLLCQTRTRISNALARNSKLGRTRELLGMEIPEYRIYLQGQFRPGMTWENYGPVWHVDHIRPCASFNLSDGGQQRECFNWSNTQPLFVTENLRKGARY